MGGEDLIEMVRREVALVRTERDGFLRQHHDRVGEAAQQHDDRQNAVHDADPLVIDAGEPLVPEIAPFAEIRHRAEHGAAAQDDGDEGRDQDGLVIGDRFPGQPSEEDLLEIKI